MYQSYWSKSGWVTRLAGVLGDSCVFCPCGTGKNLGLSFFIFCGAPKSHDSESFPFWLLFNKKTCEKKRHQITWAPGLEKLEFQAEKSRLETCADREEDFPHNISKAKVCMGAFAVLLHWHRYHCVADESTHRCPRSGGKGKIAIVQRSQR